MFNRPPAHENPDRPARSRAISLHAVSASQTVQSIQRLENEGGPAYEDDI